MNRLLTIAIVAMLPACATDPFEAAVAMAPISVDAQSEEATVDTAPRPDQAEELGHDAKPEPSPDTSPDVEESAEATSEPGAEPVQEPAPEAGPEPTTEASDEGCAADTCKAHGWHCGSALDGCGSVMQCDEAYERLGSKDSLCAATSAPPFAWGCSAGGTSTPPGPPPMPDCLWWHPTSTPTDWWWCCPGSSI